jgi:hypothetical protein
MSKILKINFNSDLNSLEVGDQFNMSYSKQFSLFEFSFWVEIEIRPSYGHRRSTVNYISKDYLIIDDDYIMLNLYSAPEYSM